jgi:hypothetical protein
MEHTEAMETLAAERYLLNEMMQEDREAFEDHFFGCTECAADVRAGTIVKAGVRASKPKAQTFRPRLVAWMSAAASIALALRLGYVSQVTIPAMQRAISQQGTGQPHRVLQYGLPFATRGGEHADVQVPHGVEPVFMLEIARVSDATGYQLTIVDAAGHAYGTPVVVTSADLKYPIPVPGGKMKPGRYSIRMKPLPAGKSAETATFDVF